MKSKLEGWREVMLGDIANISSGKRNSQDSIEFGKYPLFDRSMVIKQSDQYIFDDSAIIVPGEGKEFIPRYYQGKFDLHQRAYAIFNIKHENSIYVYYYILSNKKYFESVAVGSTVLSLRKDHFTNFPITLPTLPEQKAIAEVLNSLDDKIDLLHRQNKTLEQMAETLFRQWFIVEAKGNWEERPLKEVVDIAIGRTPPRKESQWFSTNPMDVKWISIKDMGNDGVYIFTTSEYLTKKAVETFNIPIIPKDTVILSFKMTVGRVAITSTQMLSNEAIAHFKCNNKTPFSKEYLYFYLKTFRYEILGSTSSIVTSINSAMIKNMSITIPDESIMRKFIGITEVLFIRIKHNQIKIRTLENTRDTLLPKLMRGEIKAS